MSYFDFVAGQLALDFVNTVANRLDSAKRGDLLRTPADLEAWFAAAGLPPVDSLSAVHLERAIGIREQLHAAFLACGHGSAPPEDALAAIDHSWHAGLASQRLTIAQDRVLVSWRDDADKLDRALFPVLSAAVELLASDAASRIGECEGAGCGWLFLNRSRGTSPRRWCSMRDCGNRAKAERHHARAKG